MSQASGFTRARRPTLTRPSRRALAIVSALVGVVCWSGAGAGLARADTCPNAAFRVGPAANLPDCRGYERVSPLDTNGYDINFGNQAIATDGNSVTYQSLGSFAGNPAGSFFGQYLSTRGQSGWMTVGISPPQSPGFTAPQGSQYEGFSSDLSQMVVQSDFAPPGLAPAGTFDLFQRDPTGSFHLLDPGEQTDQPQGDIPAFRGASSDFSHIVFESFGQLTADAPAPDGSDRVYESVDGQLSLVSVLPDGTPVDGSLDQTPGQAPMSHAVSADGSRIYWGDGSFIYLRQNGATTTQIDLSQCTQTPTCRSGSGPDYFWTGSTDGSLAYFTSQDRLTNDSTANSNGTGSGDLYGYDANTGQLADLTVDHAANGADVQGVIGASGDGSYVYFVANGVLARGGHAGSCGSGVTGATCNLYVWHDGTTTFVARLDDSDNGIWTSSGAFVASEFAQVSADGLHLLFTSVAAPASGYDNAGHSEVYRYDAASGTTTCVSCDPTGAPATGDAVLSAPADIGLSPVSAEETTVNNMSTDGSRVFFDTDQALVPLDTNGTDDAYEWEAAGTGSCQSAGDCLYLISSGRSGSPSHFLDASADGSDVLFLTREQLDRQDSGGNLGVFDARIGGGFPPPPASPQPCSGDDCHGQPTPAPGASTPGSASFVGPGNVTPGAPPPSTRVSVLTRSAHGTTFVVRVRVPGPGRVTVTGAQISTVRRTVDRRATVRLRIHLTGRAANRLRRTHRLRIHLRLSYRAADGRGSSRVITLTVKPKGRR